MSNTYEVIENFSKIPVASPSGINDNTNFKLVGASATCARDSSGGVVLTTTASSSGVASLQPVSTSGFGGVTWSSAKSPKNSTLVKTPASLTGVEINCGFSSIPAVTGASYINTHFTAAALIYEPALSANWVLFVTKGDGHPHIVITNIPVAVSTSYLLESQVDASGNVFFTINGLPAYFNPVSDIHNALDPLIPYAGVAGNAKTVTIAGISMSQSF